MANLVWDDEIEAHFTRHDVDLESVLAVMQGGPLTFRNLPNRGGTHVMIGQDQRGRILYVSIKPTGDPGIWEPVTGWESRLARRIWVSERGEGR